MIALADPAEEWDLSAYYYGGKAGRGPVKAEIEETYSGRTQSYRCAEYADFRSMLEKEKAIDAVLIATPDHLHAYASILAMKAGKHVYCENPLTHSVWEARTVARVAAETGVATQMGNQGRSGEGHRQTAEWLWDGAIGAVREVHAWDNAPASFGVIWRPDTRPSGTPEVPEGLDWDLWLGTRAPRPWNPSYAPVAWRGCCPRRLLGIDVDDPKQRLGEDGDGILFVGERGFIACAGWSGMPRLLPLELHRGYERPARTLPRVEGHHADWLQACKGGRPALPGRLDPGRSLHPDPLRRSRGG